MRPSKASGRVTPEGETARTPNSASAARIGRRATTSKPAGQRSQTFTVAYAPLKRPERVPKPKPPRPDLGPHGDRRPVSVHDVFPKPAKPPQPVEAFERIGTSWELIARDRLGKTGFARCLTCSEIKHVSLVSDIPSCGCNRSRIADQETFAEMISEAESIISRCRHRGIR